MIVITLFPLVIGPDPKLLSRIAPGVAWVAALLSALLSFERLFRDDFIDGSLEQLMLTAQPLALTALCKSRCTLVVNGFAVDSTFSDCRFIAFIGSEYLVGTGLLTLLMGTPILSCIGAIGVALTVGCVKVAYC